eukprot:8745990-Pyramimonas_sp.AAC.1
MLRAGWPASLARTPAISESIPDICSLAGLTSADEVLRMQTSAYPVREANRPLDASALQARRLVGFRLHRDAGDVDQEFQEADAYSSSRWRDWCGQARIGGARGLHRLTAVRPVQAPTTVNTDTGHFSAHLGDSAAAMGDEYTSIWRGTPAAPTARIPDISSLP